MLRFVATFVHPTPKPVRRFAWSIGAAAALALIALTPQPEAARAPNADATAAMEKYLARPLHPHQYRGQRKLEASGSGQRGWLNVETTFTPESGLSYNVTEEGGSGYIRSRILRSLLDEERKVIASGTTSAVAITKQNYEFTAEGLSEAGLAVVAIKPLRKERPLIAGHIFLTIDEGDLVRVEGRLAKNPSFWLSRVDMVRSYQRINDVLVPMSLETNGKLRLLGGSKLHMSYEYSEVNDRPVLLDAGQ